MVQMTETGIMPACAKAFGWELPTGSVFVQLKLVDCCSLVGAAWRPMIKIQFGEVTGAMLHRTCWGHRQSQEVVITPNLEALGRTAWVTAGGSPFAPFCAVTHTYVWLPFPHCQLAIR